MKRFILFLALCASISLYAQKKQNNAVIKTNGDTVWCDTLKVYYNGANKIKKVTLTGAAVAEIVGTDVGFYKLHEATYIISSEGYYFGRVVLVGAKSYLVVDYVTPSGYVTDVRVASYTIFDKNRKLVDNYRPQKKEDVFMLWRKNFGDCDEFLKELDKQEAVYKQKNFPHMMTDLIEKYNSSCRN